MALSRADIEEELHRDKLLSWMGNHTSRILDIKTRYRETGEVLPDDMRWLLGVADRCGSLIVRLNDRAI